MEKISFSFPEEILSDKKSGSAELLEKINNFFAIHYKQFTDLSGSINELRRHFASFHNIQAYLKQLQRLVDNKKLRANFFSDFLTNSEYVYDAIFYNSLPYLRDKKNILTISNSKTVFEILKRMNAGYKFSVTVCESRPRLEGRILARRLFRKNIEVELITEAMSAEYVRKCSCVVTGADTVLKNKNILNKIGSLQLALLCKHFRKPFYVLTDKSKFSGNNLFKQEKKSTGEIWKNAPKDIGIKNIYFEEVPYSLISKIITQ